MFKTIILCGGRGTRLSEETGDIPKPMVKIGEMPILMHIMKLYSHYNFNEFVLCLGYKQEVIKDYFYNYYKNNSALNINLNTNDVYYSNTRSEKMIVDLVNTGLKTLTGDRILKVQDYIKDDIFLLTYGDGISDVDIKDLVKFHRSHDKLVTLTAVHNVGKFGTLQIKGDTVTSFKEKPVEDNFINGGFFVLDKAVFPHILAGDFADTLEKLAKEKQLACYKFQGLWKCMDTINDKKELDDLWENGAPWKVWK